MQMIQRKADLQTKFSCNPPPASNYSMKAFVSQFLATRATPATPLSAIRHPLSAIRYPLSAIRYPLSAIRYPLSAIRYPLSAIRYPLSAILIVHSTSCADDNLLPVHVLNQRPLAAIG
jgi:hypothetical protein